MRRTQQKKRYYALFAGTVAFAAGWAAFTIIIPEGPFQDVPRWRSSLWLYLGAHGIPLSNVHLGGVGFNSTQPFSMIDTSPWVQFIPHLSAAAAAGYTCYKTSTRSIKPTVSNALAAGSAYFLAGLFAVVITNMQPGVSTLLMVGGGIAAAAWLGSSFLGTFTRGIPIFGVASLGTILAVGLLFVLGGAALLGMFWELLLISYLGAGVAGIAIGSERSLRHKGSRRDTDWPRLTAANIYFEKYWVEIFILAFVLALLYISLGGST